MNPGRFHRQIRLGANSARLLLLGLLVGLPFLPSSGAAKSLATGPKYYSIVWNFGGAQDGSFPNGGLSLNGGQLYGTTQNGGDTGYGTVFALAPSGTSFTERVIHSFGLSPDGNNPYAGVISDPTNAVYGTTAYGGFANYGTVFKLTPSGIGYTEQVIWKFGYAQDGEFLYSGLIEQNGSLYGTTQRGGQFSHGTVFKLTPSGTTYKEQILWSLGNGKDGQDPNTGLLADSSGALYGTTLAGGRHRCGAGMTCGAVFKLTPSRNGYTERVIWSFNGADGGEPESSLIEYNGALYGTTRLGGAFGAGTAFKLTPSASGYSEQVMWSFGSAGDGAKPTGGLVVKNGAFYGVTIYGGYQNGTGCLNVGCGTLFELTPSGSNYQERVVWKFGNGEDGWGPYGPLVVKGKALYGTTAAGGLYDGGTAFKLIP